MADFFTTKGIVDKINTSLGNDKKIPTAKIIGICTACNNEVKEIELKYLKSMTEYDPENPDKTYIYRSCGGCQTAQLEKENTDFMLEANKRKHFYIYEKYSIVPEALKQATFDNFILEVDPESADQWGGAANERELREMAHSRIRALEIAQGFVKDIINGESVPLNILLAGGFGVGKSYLASATINHLLAAGKTAIFVTVSDLEDWIKSTWNRSSEESEREIIQMLAAADAVCLDDIGAEGTNDWTRKMLYKIINARQGKATFYTTNAESDDLFRILQSRVYDRLRNNTQPHKILGESKRNWKMKY